MELVIAGLVALLVGLVVGILSSGKVATDRAWRQKSEFEIERARFAAELQSARERLLELDGAMAAKTAAESALADLRANSARDVAALQSKVEAYAGEIDRLRSDLRDVGSKLEVSQAETSALRASLAEREARATAEGQAAADKLDLLMKAKEELGNQFK